jgi:hypothetical protein
MRGSLAATPKGRSTTTGTRGGSAARPAAVSFAGLTYPGEYQFSITVPSVPAGGNPVLDRVTPGSTGTGDTP